MKSKLEIEKQIKNLYGIRVTDKTEEYLQFEVYENTVIDKICTGMMANNKVKNTLGFELDNKSLRYDIRNKTSINMLYPEGVSIEKLVDILLVSLQLETYISQYMLNYDTFIFMNEYIYWDNENKEILFLTVPVITRYKEANWKEIIEKLIVSLKHNENNRYLVKIINKCNQLEKEEFQEFLLNIKFETSIKEIEQSNEEIETSIKEIQKSDEETETRIEEIKKNAKETEIQIEETKKNTEETEMSIEATEIKEQNNGNTVTYIGIDQGSVIISGSAEKEEYSELMSNSEVISEPVVMNSGVIGETTVLNNGVIGETVVLAQNISIRLNRYLIRQKNNEKILINKSHFLIGKDAYSADYVINDNTAISRNHAKIIMKDDGCYVCDNNSTNCTYINEKLVLAGDEIKISNGTKLKFADEQFVYYEI